jgi:hypothetical protein
MDLYRCYDKHNARLFNAETGGSYRRDNMKLREEHRQGVWNRMLSRIF